MKEPTNEEIYRTGYMKLLAVFNDFVRESSRMENVADIHGSILRLDHVVKKIDQEGADAFNFGDRKDAADELVQEMQYTNVTLQDKYNALIDLTDRWLVTDFKDRVLNEHEYDERVAQSRAIQDLPTNAVNENYGKPLLIKAKGIISPEAKDRMIREAKAVYGDDRRVMIVDDTIHSIEEGNTPTEWTQAKEDVPFLQISLADINAVPQVWLEGKEVKNKQAVLFEYVTDDVGEDIPNYLFIQTLDSGEDKKRANVVKREYNQPIRTTGDKLTGADFF